MKGEGSYSCQNDAKQSKRKNSSRGQRPTPRSSDRPIAEGIYGNNYFMHAATSYIGAVIQLMTCQGETYEGVFRTFSSSFHVVLELAHKVDPNDPQRIDVGTVADTLIFNSHDIVRMVASNVNPDQAKEEFQTDSGISKFNGELSGEKELKPWTDEGVFCNGEEYDLASEAKTKNGWRSDEMFRANEQKYGVQSTFDETLSSYTCPIRKNATDYKMHEEKASKIAAEIERNPSSSARMALENGDDEEALYAAVSRTHPVPSSSGESDNKYVPPSKRKSNAGSRPPVARGPAANFAAPPANGNSPTFSSAITHHYHLNSQAAATAGITKAGVSPGQYHQHRGGVRGSSAAPVVATAVPTPPFLPRDRGEQRVNGQILDLYAGKGHQERAANATARGSRAGGQRNPYHGPDSSRPSHGSDASRQMHGSDGSRGSHSDLSRQSHISEAPRSSYASESSRQSHGSNTLPRYLSVRNSGESRSDTAKSSTLTYASSTGGHRPPYGGPQPKQPRAANGGAYENSKSSQSQSQSSHGPSHSGVAHSQSQRKHQSGKAREDQLSELKRFGSDFNLSPSEAKSGPSSREPSETKTAPSAGRNRSPPQQHSSTKQPPAKPSPPTLPSAHSYGSAKMSFHMSNNSVSDNRGNESRGSGNGSNVNLAELPKSASPSPITVSAGVASSIQRTPSPATCPPPTVKQTTSPSMMHNTQTSFSSTTAHIPPLMQQSVQCIIQNRAHGTHSPPTHQSPPVSVVQLMQPQSSPHSSQQPSPQPSPQSFPPQTQQPMPQTSQQQLPQLSQQPPQLAQQSLPQQLLQIIPQQPLPQPSPQPLPQRPQQLSVATPASSPSANTVDYTPSAPPAHEVAAFTSSTLQLAPEFTPSVPPPSVPESYTILEHESPPEEEQSRKNSEPSVEECTQTLEKSTLNPNAKEFVFNPSRPFTPASVSSKSPSTPTQSRPHTPQTPSYPSSGMHAASAVNSVAAAAAAAAAGLQMMMPAAYVLPSSYMQANAQSAAQTRSIRKVTVGPHRDYHSSMHVSAATATGQPLVQPSALAQTALAHGSQFTAIQGYSPHPHIAAAAAQPYQHVQMVRMVPQQGGSNVLVPTSLGYHHQHDGSHSGAAGTLYVNHGGVTTAAVAVTPTQQQPHVHLHSAPQVPPSTAPSPSHTPQGPSQSHTPIYQPMVTQSAPPYQSIMCPVIQASPHGPPHHMVATGAHTMQQYLQHQQGTDLRVYYYD